MSILLIRAEFPTVSDLLPLVEAMEICAVPQLGHLDTISLKYHIRELHNVYLQSRVKEGWGCIPQSILELNEAMQKRLGSKGEMTKVGGDLCAAVDAITDTAGIVDFPRLFTDFARGDVPNTHATYVCRMVSDSMSSSSRGRIG